MNGNKIKNLDKKDIKKLTLETYPNAESTNLIEYFLIVGYEESYIQEKIINKIIFNPNVLTELEEQEKKNKKISQESKVFNEYKFRDLPTILSSISTNFPKPMIPEKLIIKNVFPIPPSVFYMEVDNFKHELVPLDIVFTNIHNDEVNIGYSYIFYESKIIEKVKIYIPKAFVIISQYPFFMIYKKICKELEKQFKNENIQIPIEIQLYNVINFMSAPINSPYDITFFLSNDLSVTDSCKSESQFINLNGQQKYTLKQLSGYRYSEIDISAILYLLSVDIIIEVYIQLLTGRTVAVFCKNLQILNMTLYIFQQFFYPFSVNECVNTYSPIKFYYPERFLPNIVGFFCSFDEIGNYDPKKEENAERISFLSQFEDIEDFEQGLFECDFILDLDKGKFEYSGINNIYAKNVGEKEEEIKKILEFTKRILEYKENDFSLLKKSLKNLIILLREISFKLHRKNKDNKTPDYFNNEETYNRRIQNAFYQFNLDIAFEFVRQYICFNDDGIENIENNKTKVKPKKETNLNDEEIFFTLFSNHQSSNIILNIVGGYSPEEPLLYKTPRIIFEHLINFKKINRIKESDDNTYQNDYFSLIDQVYEINKNKETKVYTFLNFYKYYKEKLADKFYYLVNNKYVDAKINKRNNSNIYRYKYKTIDLDQNLILEYVYSLDELTLEEKNKLFNIKNIPIYQIIPYVNIDQIIEHQFLSEKNTDYMNIIILCILNILVLSIHYKTINPFSDMIYEIFRKNTISIRKYTEIILYMVLQFLSEEKNPNYYQYEKYLNLYQICVKEKGQLPNDMLIYLKREIEKFKNLSDKKNVKIIDERYEKIKNVETKKLYEIKCKKKPKDIIPIISNVNINDSFACELTFKSKFYKNNQKITNKVLYSPLLIYEETSKYVKLYYQNKNPKSIETTELIWNIIFMIYYVNLLSDNNDFLKNLDRFLFLCLDLD